MKNQFPIRILLMGAVATSSTLPADHSNSDDEYWNVQWKADTSNQNQAGHKTAKPENSPEFFSLEEPENAQPHKSYDNDDDWGLESHTQKDDKSIAQNTDILNLNPGGAKPEPVTIPGINPTTPQSQQINTVQPTPQANQLHPNIPANTPPNTPGEPTPPKTISINFSNISIVEYIRFISRITGKNFIFDEKDLAFTITIVSEGPTSIQNVMTTLLQALRAHNYNLMEDGNTIMIYRNDDVRNVAKVSINDVPTEDPLKNEIITQIFRLNTLDPSKAVMVIKPLLSKTALMEVSIDTRQIIITDLLSNITQIATLLKGLDSPGSGQVIGQYVVRNSTMDVLIDMTKQIMAPIANDQPLTVVQYPNAQSIFIISTPFLVERTLSVLQYLDQKKGENKIFGLEDLKFTQVTKPREGLPESETPSRAGRWEIDSSGKWVFRPGGIQVPGELPQGRWVLDPQGNWYFIPEGTKAPFEETTKNGELLKAGQAPNGTWVQDENGNWIYQLSPGESIRPEYLRREVQHYEELPVGHIERTKFFLYKLKYRNGKEVVAAIESIGKSLEESGVINKDLSLSISTLQWIEPTNSIIITGTSNSIQKIRELIEEIDTVLKQVFIEMLVIETDLDDSLNFGVSWGAHAAGGSTSIAEAFLSGASSLGSTLFNGLGARTPDVGSTAPANGFTLGVIGQKLTHNGLVFSDLAVLAKFMHDQTQTNIIMNPKVIAEDNKPAEIFIGQNTAFQNESIANDLGSIITTNYQFRDVGTTLNVTPHIGSNDLINLEIKLENSAVTEGVTTASGQVVSNSANAGPTTSINRTTTNVIVPDGYFLILSGMLSDSLSEENFQVPCLGGVPAIGWAFKSKTRMDTKRNLMIFIRPVIVKSDEQINELTKRQQDIFHQKTRVREDWQFHMEQALDWTNLRETCDPCENCID